MEVFDETWLNKLVNIIGSHNSCHKYDVTYNSGVSMSDKAYYLCSKKEFLDEIAWFRYPIYSLNIQSVTNDTRIKLIEDAQTYKDVINSEVFQSIRSQLTHHPPRISEMNKTSDSRSHSYSHHPRRHRHKHEHEEKQAIIHRNWERIHIQAKSHRIIELYYIHAITICMNCWLAYLSPLSIIVSFCVLNIINELWDYDTIVIVNIFGYYRMMIDIFIP